MIPQRTPDTLRRMKAAIWLCFVVLSVTFVGCGPLKIRNVVPAELVDVAVVPGMPGVRFHGDELDPELKESLLLSWKQEKQTLGLKDHEPFPETSYLAISGGGPDGAFGAGLLVGWTQHGSRPQFKIVTGVSTGALIAPFAFLGSEYDEQLKTVYTTIGDKDIFKVRSLVTIFRGDSVADTTPLFTLTEKYITEGMLDKIAIEHQKGRRLLVGTTNLDTQRPVIWDMGAIAGSSSPDRVKLFRKVLVASASIPVAFSPQYIDVVAGGQKFEEMHVDGGTTRELFLYPVGLRLIDLRESVGIHRRGNLFMIVNNHLGAQYEPTKSRLNAIAMRSIFTLTKSTARGDLIALYLSSERDNISFNLASIPDEIKLESRSVFDQQYMKKLFSIGYGMSVNGFPWASVPPGLDTAVRSPTTAPSTPLAP
jgi:hypothetical protein